MPPIVTSNNDNNNKSKIIIVSISVVVVVLIAVLVTLGIYFVNKNNHANQVKDEINTAVAALEKSRVDNGAYPIDVSDILNIDSKNVELTGETSFDGTSFCISGKSTTDDKMSYYVKSSNSNSEPVEGTCEKVADSTAPLTPGGLAVAFASASSIKITWDKALYATEYTLQCSDDDGFVSPVSVTASDISGQCDNLKSNKMYYYRVKATNKTGDSDWSIIQQMSTL